MPPQGLLCQVEAGALLHFGFDAGFQQGQEGVVVEVYGDGYVSVRFEDGNTWDMRDLGLKLVKKSARRVEEEADDEKDKTPKSEEFSFIVEGMEKLSTTCSPKPLPWSVKQPGESSENDTTMFS